MNCAEFQEKLYPYLYGLLEGADLRAAEEHAASCASCARALADGRRAVDRLDTWRPEAAPLSERTARRLRLQEAADRRSRMAWLQAAAILAVGVALGIALFSIPAARPLVEPQPEAMVSVSFLPEEAALPRLDENAPALAGTLTPAPGAVEGAEPAVPAHLPDLPEAPPAIGEGDGTVVAESTVKTPAEQPLLVGKGMLAGGKADPGPRRTQAPGPAQAMSGSAAEPRRDDPYGSLSSHVQPSPGLPVAGLLHRQEGAGFLETRVDAWLSVDPAAAPAAAMIPFRGLPATERGAALCRSWFERRVGEAVALYERQGSRLDFFRSGPDKDLSLQFLCRAFQPDMDAVLKKGVKNISRDPGLRARLADRYVRTAAHHAYKQLHRPAGEGARQPAFLEPLMAAFAYGDAWIALAESCAASGLEPGQELFKAVFLPEAVLERLGDSLAARPERSAWWLLAMPEGRFQEYRRLCVQDWLAGGRYRLSGHEESRPVQGLP